MPGWLLATYDTDLPPGWLARDIAKAQGWVSEWRGEGKMVEDNALSFTARVEGMDGHADLFLPLPPAALERLGWKEGDDLRVDAAGEGVLVVAKGDGDAGYGVPPEPRRVIWEMTYHGGEKEMVFEDRLALAALLMAEEVFVNGAHWKGKDRAEDITVLAICNDVFAWGCSDAEEVPWSELRNLYEHFVKDARWGVAVWCMKRRGEMPQRPVAARIREAGVWDLDGMGLEPNHYDATLAARSAT